MVLPLGLVLVAILLPGAASAQWTQLGLDIDGESAGDLSGRSVALSSDGTRVAIGAPFNDDYGTGAGHVRVYEYFPRPIDGWLQIGGDIDGDDVGGVFGSSVSLSADGSRVAIGAPQNDVYGYASGLVRVY